MAWILNGISPQLVENVDKDEYPKAVTLHCVAYSADNLTAEEQINRFREVAASEMNREPLLNGGDDLQFSADGQLITVSDGVNSWDGVLHHPEITENLNVQSAIVITDDGSLTVDEVIKYDLKIELAYSLEAAYTVYRPDYRVYPNVDYDPYNIDSPYSATSKIGQTVSEGTWPIPNPENAHWEDLNNVKAADGQLARMIDIGKLGTRSIDMTNFGINIPSMDVVTRVQVIVRTANNSSNSTKLNFVRVTGPSMDVQATKPLNVNTDPSNMKNVVFDTADGSLPSFSTDPATYNSSSFKVQFAANLDKYKMCWVDYIQVKVWHKPVFGYYADFNGTDLEDFIVLSGSWSESEGLLKSTSTPPEYPAGSGIGAVVTEDMYQPEVIEAKVVIAPSSRMGFVFGRTSSDFHWEAVYLGGGTWRIVTLNDDDSVPATIKASAQAWDLVGDTTYWFKVTISKSGLIKFYCNGTLMVQYNNKSPIPEGNVGCRAWGAAGSTFDKFKISQSLPVDDPSFTGAEIGSMAIVEQKDVKQIEITGSACNLPAWIEVNGERYNWKYSRSHDPGEVGGVDGEQTLTFSISPPSQVININTSPNYPPSLGGYTADRHRGATLKMIRVYYA